MIGLVAGVITTSSFLPQAITVYRRKSGEDLSYSYLCSFAFGVCLWLTYGLNIHSRPIIFANLVTLALVILIILFKAHFARHNPPGQRRAQDKARAADSSV
jgi:MtN3 and saliva related transmembrane protein